MTDGKDSAFAIGAGTPPKGIGLTKREYFAAMAMQGILSGYTETNVTGLEKVLCESAVNYSDALIAELNKPS